jgi:hypothetical protein
LTAKRYYSRIVSDVIGANKLWLDQTPSVLINGKLLAFEEAMDIGSKIKEIVK